MDDTPEYDALKAQYMEDKLARLDKWLESNRDSFYDELEEFLADAAK